MGTTKQTILLMRAIVCTLLILSIVSSAWAGISKKDLKDGLRKVIKDCCDGNDVKPKARDTILGLYDDNFDTVYNKVKNLGRRRMLNRKLGLVQDGVNAGCESAFEAIKTAINGKTSIPKEVINCAKPEFKKKCSSVCCNAIKC